MRILLVEDDLSLADGLRSAFRREGFATDHVTSGSTALEAIRTDAPELVLLDLGLPDMDGLEVLRQLHRFKNPPLVLVLTARDTTEDKVTGLDYGADDYLAKPFEISELLARVRALDRRTTGNRAPEICIGPVILNASTHQVRVQGVDTNLTRREFTLLKALMETPGRILSREQLESRLYGWGEELVSNSIEVHVHHLRKKLPAEFIKTVRGVGYTVRKQ